MRGAVGDWRRQRDIQSQCLRLRPGLPTGPLPTARTGGPWTRANPPSATDGAVSLAVSRCRPTHSSRPPPTEGELLLRQLSHVVSTSHPAVSLPCLSARERARRREAASDNVRDAMQDTAQAQHGGVVISVLLAAEDLAAAVVAASPPPLRDGQGPVAARRVGRTPDDRLRACLLPLAAAGPAALGPLDDVQRLRPLGWPSLAVAYGGGRRHHRDRYGRLARGGWEDEDEAVGSEPASMGGSAALITP